MTMDRSPEAVAARRARIKALVTDGQTTQQIADELGVTHDFVYNVCRLHLGIKPNPGPRRRAAAVTKRYEQIRALATAGWSSSQIAAEVGVTASNVADICKKERIAITAGRQTWRKDSEIASKAVVSAETAAEVLSTLDVGQFEADEAKQWDASLNETLRLLSTFQQKLQGDQ